MRRNALVISSLVLSVAVVAACPGKGNNGDTTGTDTTPAAVKSDTTGTDTTPKRLDTTGTDTTPAARAKRDSIAKGLKKP